MKYSSALPVIAGILAAFCIKSSVSQANQRCYTPDQALGQCVDIFSCDSLFDDLKNPQRTPEQTLYLRQSKCNQIGSILYVCCKLKSTSRTNVNLLPSTRECGIFFGNRIYGGEVTQLDEFPWLALIEYTKYTDQQCFTPDGASGQCINILKCDPLLEVLINVQRTPEQTQYLQKSQCDYVDSKVYVCCNFERTSRSYVDLLPSTRECGKSFDNRIYGGNVTRIDEYPWLALIEYTKHKGCKTPNNDVGACIDLLKCESLLTILKNVQRSAQETQFLQKSQCAGQEQGKVYVCCKIEAGSRFNKPTDLLPTTKECGKSFDNRIYGGNVTRIDEYPWLALIEYTKPANAKGFHCGAALINKRYVITAAHCVTGIGIPSDWTPTGIRLGEWDRSTDRDCEQLINGNLDCAEPHMDIPIEEIVHHEQYNSRDPNHLYDIAVIRLSRDVAYTDFVSPVCLPTQTQLRTKRYDGVKMDVTGFGATEDGTSSALKLKAGVDVWNLQTCRQKYGPKKVYLQESQMCAGGQAGVDSCSGDSGGPLVVKEKVDNRDVYMLAGIVSFGPKPCGLPGWPGVYTHVGTYADWIMNNIKA